MEPFPKGFHLPLYLCCGFITLIFSSEGKIYFKTLSLQWGKEKKPRGKNSEAKEFLRRYAFRPVVLVFNPGINLLGCFRWLSCWSITKSMRWAFEKLKSMWVQGLESVREKHDSMQRRLINLVYIKKKKYCDHLRRFYFNEKPDFAEEHSIYCRSAEGVDQESLKLQVFSPNNVNSFLL